MKKLFGSIVVVIALSLVVFGGTQIVPLAMTGPGVGVTHSLMNFTK